MVFVTKVYANLTFYIPSKEEYFQFKHGVFDTEDVDDSRERSEVEKVLSKLAANPGFTGVQLIEETKMPFNCDVCGKGFPNQNAKFGHQGRAHKSETDINAEALQEGQTLPGNVTV